MSILLEYCNDLQILNEAYYGKPREFIEIEKNLTAIIKMVKMTKENPRNAVDINKMKEVKNIENIFTKFFGNKETSITFYSVSIGGIDTANNAFTIPSSLAFFKKDKNNKKNVDPKNLFINVNIDIGLIYGLDMTEQELMATILHEIGHCFDASFFSFLANFSIDFTKIVDKETIISVIIPFIVKSEPYAKIIQALNRLVSSNPIISQIVNDILLLIQDIKRNKMYFDLLQRGILSGKLKPKLSSIINPSNLFGYAGEKFADSFATSYGYGLEIQSFMNKLQNDNGKLISSIMSEIPLLNIGYDLVKTTTKVALLLCDPHPDYVIRIKSQIKKLKRDLKDPNLKDSVRKELEANIADMEQFVDKVYLNFDEDDNRNRPISYLWNFVMYKAFDNKLDPREWIEVIFNHEL